MRLRFTKSGGEPGEFALGGEPVVIGRDPEADLTIADEKASRRHCVIEPADDAYRVRDLGSKNGTFVNGARVDTAPLSPGDRIRVGGLLLTFEDEKRKGERTMLREVAEEMDGGKGFGTIVRELVGEAENRRRPGVRPETGPAKPAED